MICGLSARQFVLVVEYAIVKTVIFAALAGHTSVTFFLQVIDNMILEHLHNRSSSAPPNVLTRNAHKINY